MSSMGNDLVRGNRLELPWLAGKVVQLGRCHGIPTPVNEFVYAALKLYADVRQPGKSVMPGFTRGLVHFVFAVVVDCYE